MNPFLTKGYIEPIYFCDRVGETKVIREAIENNRDVILYGRRRMGKSALIKHVLHLLGKNYIGIWVDRLPTQNLQDLINTLATAVLASFEEKSNLGRKIWSGIKTLRPNIGYDSLTGQPSVSFVNQSNNALKRTFSDLVHLVNNVNKKIVIALDEFQQIINYPEENVESYL